MGRNRTEAMVNSTECRRTFSLFPATHLPLDLGSLRRRHRMVRVVTGSQRALAWSLLAACLLGASAFVPKAFADKGEKEFKAGFQAEVRRDWDEAVRRYQEALNLEPDNPQYMLAVGRARFQAGVTHLS